MNFYWKKKEDGGGCYFCYIWLFISFSRISSRSFCPTNRFPKLKQRFEHFLFSFFFPWRCSFPRRLKKNDSSYLCNIFFYNGKDRFTFLTTVFQRFGKQLVYFVLQNYHCNKSSCHSLPHIVTIFSLWWGLLKSTLLATIKCRLHY